MKRIIYPNEIGIAVIIPCDCGLIADEIAIKDVPEGVAYKIIDTNDIPIDRTNRDAWEADFTSPDGYGGAK